MRGQAAGNRPATQAPLVSCILVTRNRPRFLPQALRCFRRQSYRNAELILVDDSDESMERLCAKVPSLQYIRLSRPTPSGTKLNIGIQAARAPIIQILDDDDFYGPGFVASSVSHLPKSVNSVVTRCCFLVLLRGDPVLRHSGHGWKPSSFCFHRALWEKRPYRDLKRSCDSWFLYDHNPRLVRICDIEQYMVVRHGANTWNTVNGGQSADAYLSGCEPYGKRLKELLPREDARFYRSLVTSSSSSESGCLRSASE